MNACNRLAEWMIANSIATGHGDTVDDLLMNLSVHLNGLRAENFTLAAGQCIVDGGLVGDEGGTPYCSLKKEVERLRAELVTTRELLREAHGAMYSSFPDEGELDDLGNRIDAALKEKP